MRNNQECAEYFKSQAAYRRCFLELRKKWQSYGRAAGMITLGDASKEECRAIGGIVGKTFFDGKIRFSFSAFEKGLQRTRYAPVDMKEVLEHYFGETLSTNQEQRKEEQERKQEFLEQLCRFFETDKGSGSAAYRWMREMSDTGKYGYQLLIREYGKDRPQAEALAKAIGAALTALEAEGEDGTERPLAVFAAEISGNPHYLDRGTTAGQLFMNAVCWYRKKELPKSAHQWRELLLDVGIVPDNVSSIVHACGLRLAADGGFHPAYDAFCELKEPCVITLENLKGITGAKAVGAKVYVVENEMVFSYLAEHVKISDATLLCTSGQLRTAALELIRMILASGAKIYYSGDMDPEGIDIADRLWQKYGSGIHIWRMQPDDYARSVSEEQISTARLAKLDHIKNPILKETARCVKEQKRAAYQENLLDELVGDIIFYR